ncbi:3'-5' exonuclease [Bradyrhizobium sp. AZCC 2289]|uniref:3'-5' exonuclease n=1 Tax=Bradyrhizobium sp. AZCC 2289 TaxID=3117026 RepID=UPI002FF3AF98
MSKEAYDARLPALSWAPQKRHTSVFRIAFRNMLPPKNERTLIAALIPPGIWAIFAAYRARLDQENLSEPEDAYRAAREILAAKPALLPYRAVVVDEAQDLGAEAFKLIAAIAPKADGGGGKAAPDSLFVVGDAHQRIYGRKASMTKCGIDVRGRSKKLKVCYRTSDEIRRWAVAVMEGVTVDDLDESSDDLRGYRSLFHGPVPEVLIAKTTAGEMNALTEWIENCKDDGIDESDICVLSRTNPILKEIGEALKQKGYKTVQIAPGEADNRAKSGIRLSTMHRSKGLEFSAVALVRINEDVVPPKALLSLAPDAAIRRSLIAGEKSLIHVSATRAKRKLFVSSSGQPGAYRKSHPAILMVQSAQDRAADDIPGPLNAARDRGILVQ